MKKMAFLILGFMITTASPALSASSCQTLVGERSATERLEVLADLYVTLQQSVNSSSRESEQKILTSELSQILKEKPELKERFQELVKQKLESSKGEARKKQSLQKTKDQVIRETKSAVFERVNNFNLSMMTSYQSHGDLVIAESGTNSFTAFSIPDLKVIFTFSQKLQSVQLHPSKPIAALRSFDGTVEIFDFKKNQSLHRISNIDAGYFTLDEKSYYWRTNTTARKQTANRFELDTLTEVLGTAESSHFQGIDSTLYENTDSFKIYRAEDLKLLQALPNIQKGFTLRAEQRSYLLYSAVDQVFYLVDPAGKIKEKFPFTFNSTVNSTVTRYILSPDEKFIAAQTNLEIIIIEVGSGKIVKTFQSQNLKIPGKHFFLSGFSPKNDFLLFNENAGSIDILEINTGTYVPTEKLDYIHRIYFLNDGVHALVEGQISDTKLFKVYGEVK